jgi:tetratricopeptide (TPR) repeat protein
LRRTIDTDIHRAIGFLGAGKKARALACLRALDAWSETNAIRCNLAGLIYLSAEKNQPALEWFDRALALDPANLEALSNRGLALQDLGRTVDALAAYEEAARAGCAKPALFYNRGNLLRGAGRLTRFFTASRRRCKASLICDVSNAPLPTHMLPLHHI